MVMLRNLDHPKTVHSDMVQEKVSQYSGLSRSVPRNVKLAQVRCKSMKCGVYFLQLWVWHLAWHWQAHSRTTCHWCRNCYENSENLIYLGQLNLKFRKLAGCQNRSAENWWHFIMLSCSSKPRVVCMASISQWEKEYLGCSLYKVSDVVLMNVGSAAILF